MRVFDKKRESFCAIVAAWGQLLSKCLSKYFLAVENNRLIRQTRFHMFSYCFACAKVWMFEKQEPGEGQERRQCHEQCFYQLEQHLDGKSGKSLRWRWLQSISGNDKTAAASGYTTSGALQNIIVGCLEKPLGWASSYGQLPLTTHIMFDTSVKFLWIKLILINFQCWYLLGLRPWIAGPQAQRPHLWSPGAPALCALRGWSQHALRPGTYSGTDVWKAIGDVGVYLDAAST